MHCLSCGSHPPCPPFARGGKTASGLFSPLAKGGHRGVFRVPLCCARFVIHAIENRSRYEGLSRSVEHIGARHSRARCGFLLRGSSGDTMANCLGEFREIRESHERTGIAADVHHRQARLEPPRFKIAGRLRRPAGSRRVEGARRIAVTTDTPTLGRGAAWCK